MVEGAQVHFWLAAVDTEGVSTLAREAGQSDSFAALSAAAGCFGSLLLGFFHKRDAGRRHGAGLRLGTTGRCALLDLLEALRAQEVPLRTAEEAVAISAQLAATTVLKLLSHIN